MMQTMQHPWERLQAEKERQAAFETVERLALALAEAEAELEYRRQLFGEARAAVDENRREMMAAHELGARTVHAPGRRLPEAEAVYVGVPPGAVAALTRALIADPGLQDREQEALNTVANLDRRVLQVARTLEHWRTVAGTGSTPSSGSPSSGSPSSDSPVTRAPAGPIEPEAAKAEAAEVVGASAHSALSAPPASGSGSIRERLAELAGRVQGW